MRCRKCGTVITKDEDAMTRTLVNRGMNDFYCADCLAAFEVTPQEILENHVFQRKRRYAVCVMCIKLCDGFVF